MIFLGWTLCINGEIKYGEIKCGEIKRGEIRHEEIRYGKIKPLMEKYHNLSVG